MAGPVLFDTDVLIDVGRGVDAALDALVAATALTQGVPLVSKNQRDYRFIPDLQLLPYPHPFGSPGPRA